MRIALISDVHANLEALQVALAWIKQSDIEQIYCLGDVVGYGADPDACCELVRTHCNATLLGNHDAAVIGVMDTDYYYLAAREAIYWTRKQLSEENFKWLYGLPYTLIFQSVGLYHAAPIQPSGFYYVARTRDAAAHAQMYDTLPTWNFVGHTHLTSAYVLNESGADEMHARTIAPPLASKLLVNVGSVGQPRDRDERLCFGVYDTEAQTFEHVRLDYDIESAARKIEAAGLEPNFASRLFKGH